MSDHDGQAQAETLRSEDRSPKAEHQATPQEGLGREPFPTGGPAAKSPGEPTEKPTNGAIDNPPQGPDPGEPADKPTRVAGRVHDRVTGKAIGAVDVSLASGEDLGMTGNEGRFRTTIPPERAKAGQVVLHFAKPRYLKHPMEVKVLLKVGDTTVLEPVKLLDNSASDASFAEFARRSARQPDEAIALWLELRELGLNPTAKAAVARNFRPEVVSERLKGTEDFVAYRELKAPDLRTVRKVLKLRDPKHNATPTLPKLEGLADEAERLPEPVRTDLGKLIPDLGQVLNRRQLKGAETIRKPGARPAAVQKRRAPFEAQAGSRRAPARVQKATRIAPTKADAKGHSPEPKAQAAQKARSAEPKAARTPGADLVPAEKLKRKLEVEERGH